MDQVKIGKFIAELRHENNFTQEALGEKIGVTNKTISRWENGNYMPDIEMLQVLSKEFHVSINELLCGKRLNDSSYRQEAENNLIDVLEKSSFSKKEQSVFWKNKWIKEHLCLIIVCTVLSVVIFVWAWLVHKYWLMGLCPAGWLLLYSVIRNKMMIYIENKIYSAVDKPDREKL